MTRGKKRGKRGTVEEREMKANRPPPEWGKCESCGQVLPIVRETGMCGPCTFGEADTLLTAGE